MIYVYDIHYSEPLNFLGYYAPPISLRTPALDSILCNKVRSTRLVKSSGHDLN